jgi:hypothetical protein
MSIPLKRVVEKAAEMPLNSSRAFAQRSPYRDLFLISRNGNVVDHQN